MDDYATGLMADKRIVQQLEVRQAQATSTRTPTATTVTATAATITTATTATTIATKQLRQRPFPQDDMKSDGINDYHHRRLHNIKDDNETHSSAVHVMFDDL